MVEKCYFSVRNITYEKLADGYKIILVTDVACHLYMRWTNVKPQIHDLPSWRRGIFMHGDRYFCFVAYHDNEQVEDGNTLTHTFIKQEWLSCETRWFYFWGQDEDMICASTTAPFKLHFQAEDYQLVIKERWSRRWIKPPTFYYYLKEPWG